jgi:L-ascorbate metabolism protein UlaG (beta-lactamase superfamily)
MHPGRMRRLLITVLVLLALGAGWLLYRLNDRPSLDAYASFALASRDDAAPGPHVSVSFLGVSTLLISDDETSLMTDGFFTRPAKASVFLGRIAPDPDRIAQSLERAGARKLAAVIAVHSHYDHAMDSPEVARRTGALLVGSESTANIGRGVGFPEERIRVLTPGEPMRLGGFTLTPVLSRHFPHGMAMGEIREPLVPPASAMDYLDGGSFSLLVAHEAGSLLVQGSAGWREGALSGRQADVVLLGIGGLGGRDEAYREDYWREVVEPVGARCVIPIHWDDFTLALDAPLEPAPRLLDDVPASMAFLTRKTVGGAPALGLLPAWKPVRLLGAGAAACGAPR